MDSVVVAVAVAVACRLAQRHKVGEKILLRHPYKATISPLKRTPTIDHVCHTSMCISCFADSMGENRENAGDGWYLTKRLTFHLLHIDNDDIHSQILCRKKYIFNESEDNETMEGRIIK